MGETIPRPPSPHAASAPPFPRWLWVFAAAALAARVLVFLQYLKGPLAAYPMMDAYVYWEWAGRIAAGEWLPREAFHQAPLYPYTLGVARAVARDLTPQAVSFAQLLVNWGTALLLYPITVRRFGHVAGAAAVVIGLLFTPAVFFALKLLPVTVGLAFAVAGVHLLDGEVSTRRRAAAGLCWGAAGLCFPGFLLGLPAILGVELVRGGADPWRRTIPPLLACALVILPVTAANLANRGGLVLISSNFGITFRQGNNPEAAGGYTPLQGVSRDISFQERDAAIQAEKELGEAGLSPAQVARHHLGRGLDFVLSHPADWLRLEARKAALLISGRPVALDYSMEMERRDTMAALLLLPVSATAVLLLAALAIRPLLADRTLPASLAAAALAQGLVCLVFFVSDRYALPFQFLLIPFAAAGAASVRRWIADPLAWAATIPVLVCAALFTVLIDPTVWEANYLANLGFLHAEREHRLELALDYYERSLAIRPGNPDVLTKVADIKLFTGRFAEAIDGYRRALAVDPFSAAAREGLVRALSRPGLREESEREVAENPGSAKALFHRSQARWAAGDAEGAMGDIQAATALDRSFCGAMNSLAVDEYVGGNYELAAEAMRRAEGCGFPVNPSFKAALLARTTN